MKRRAFIAALGGAAAWPIAARAQQNSGLRKVGVLFPGVLGGERERLITEGLISELGDDRAVLLVRSAEGNSQLLAKYASELVVDRVDVILAIASGSLEAARQGRKPFRSSRLTSNPILSRRERCKASTGPVAM
jgi:hypothetical protein